MTDASWTLQELVGEVAARIARLPEPTNGQIRAVPDERTVRYYGTIGLLARPVAMRGRTALYGRRHLAQVVAIKRLQAAGRSLAEITAVLPGMDDHALQRMSGVEMPRPAGAKGAFWKQAPIAPAPVSIAPEPEPEPEPPHAAAELRLELAPNVHVTIALSDDSIVTSADLRAIRAAAAALVTELTNRRLIQERQP